MEIQDWHTCSTPSREWNQLGTKSLYPQISQLGYKFIPFAAETYGKMGEAALQVVRTLGSAAAEESAPRPWHARTFADATVQRLSVALQRGVQEDQLLRAHVRRTRHLFGVNDGGAPGGGAATESVVARAGAARRAEVPVHLGGS